MAVTEPEFRIALARGGDQRPAQRPTPVCPARTVPVQWDPDDCAETARWLYDDPDNWELLVKPQAAAWFLGHGLAWCEDAAAAGHGTGDDPDRLPKFGAKHGTSDPAARKLCRLLVVACTGPPLHWTHWTQPNDSGIELCVVVGLRAAELLRLAKTVFGRKDLTITGPPSLCFLGPCPIARPAGSHC